MEFHIVMRIKKEINHKKISQRFIVDRKQLSRQPSFDDCRRKRFVGRSTGKAHPKADGIIKLKGS